MTVPEDLQPQRTTYNLPFYKPVVTWILLGVIAVVFGLETLIGGSTDTKVLIRMGAKFNPLITAGEYWRLFTAMFLHIGVMHLIFNGYALLVIGTELERLLGWGRFLAIYLLSGLFGSLASYAFGISLSAGASGAIFGLIGALAAFFTLYRQQLGRWGQRRLANIIFLIAINLFLGFTQPGIDNLGHMGGLVSGFALGWALVPRYKADPIQQRVIDRNRFGQYWSALAVAVLLFVGGTALTAAHQRDSLDTRLWHVEQAIEREAWTEAIAEAEQALAKDPDSAELYFYLGLAHNNLGQPELAAEAYEAVLALEPDDPATHWNLALTYLELDRPAEARQHFETYLRLNPDEAEEVQPYLQLLESAGP
jgi:rhomboid protease GluP